MDGTESGWNVDYHGVEGESGAGHEMKMTVLIGIVCDRLFQIKSTLMGQMGSGVPVVHSLSQSFPAVEHQRRRRSLTKLMRRM